MHTAIYIRQSIEKKDSLSLEAQEKICASICASKNWNYEIYRDSGYSGKNIKRPAMNSLITQIKTGNIARVIVYKMDRISRSVLDFAGLLDMFEKNNVAFISSTEQFDTSTAMGKAMVYITMTFAQMERETIRERIKASCLHRAKQGLFIGGNYPYGFTSTKININNKMQSVLKIDHKTAHIVKDIYIMYTIDNMSLNGAASRLNDQEISSPRNKRWTSSGVKKILRNPAYAPNTPLIYKYYHNKDYNIINNISEYNGNLSLYVGGTLTGSGEDVVINRNEDRYLAIARHKSLISDTIWLAAQKRLDNNINTGKLGTAKHSWLSGICKCKECGHNMEITKNSSGVYYLKCGGRTQRGLSSCSNSKYHRVKTIEMLIYDEMKKHLDKFDANDYVIETNNNNNPDLEIQIVELDIKIDNLVKAIENGESSSPILNRIRELQNNKQNLLDKLIPVQEIDNVKRLSAHDKFINTWDKSSIDDRKIIVRTLLKSIQFNGEDIRVIFRV